RTGKPAQRFAPAGLPGKFLQFGPLPRLALSRRFHNPILQLVRHARTARTQPSQNVLGQLAVVRPTLDQVPGSGSQRGQPGGALMGKQFPKYLANADVRVKIALASNGRPCPLVVATFRTVEG